MFNVGGQEFALIILLALVVVGPEQLPGLIRKLGQYAAQARQMSGSLRAEFMAATEPMQDSLKEFQEGMNDFQSGVTDFGKTVTDAADPKKWGAGTADDPIVPRGFADAQADPDAAADPADAVAPPAETTPASAAATAAAATGAAQEDPWAADRIQPITQPTREKKLEVTPPVNPWAALPGSGADVAAVETGSVAAQAENAARHLETHQTDAAVSTASLDAPSQDADEEPA